ncbi:MAG: lysozyme [Bacteroidales bacterium]|jgi:lysozyme|nr:lysozyme [Bacteroidales bacterium]
MKISEKGIRLIKNFEGCKLQAYKDSAGVPTIGYGTIVYHDTDKRVAMGDTITQERAEYELSQYLHEMQKRLPPVNKLKQNQYDAVCSFCYNLGIANFKSSTLYKRIQKDPNDATIRDEFMKWVNAGGKKIQGLVNRRKAEVDVYFG